MIANVLVEHGGAYVGDLQALREVVEIDYYAVSIVEPRNPVDKIVGKLSLLA